MVWANYMSPCNSIVVLYFKAWFTLRHKHKHKHKHKRKHKKKESFPFSYAYAYAYVSVKSKLQHSPPGHTPGI